MGSYRIAAIGGDGIGPEVIEAGLTVLDALQRRDPALKLAVERFDWGSDYYKRHGVMMPADGVERLRPFDAIYFGAVGSQDVPDHITLWGLRLAICQGFDQYANVRPTRILPGLQSPLRGAEPGDLDWVIVRENTEGEYAQVGGFVYMAQPEEVAIQTSVFTRRGIERVVRYAFELAVKRGRKMRVTSITKSNAQGYGMALWDRTFHDVAIEFPGIQTESLLVDAAAMNFIRRPDSFDVVVASNLFGDILSDISAIIVGSMGLAASANLDPSRRFPSMFEPVHGSAPDIAGTGRVNPLAAILSASMMLEHLEQPAAAREVEQAVAAVLAEGKVRTPDLGGASSTQEVTDAVLDKMD
jgi:tartrate dehydrogenase/decarboxylase/D-malate dehydrogenase